MDLDNTEFFEEFLEDMSELLENLDSGLQNLENRKTNQNDDIINEVFRYAHSLKGMAAAMEFEKMEALTHKMEDVLYDIREGKLEYNEDIFKLFVRGKNYLHKILECVGNTGGEDDEALEGIDELVSNLASYLTEEDGLYLESEDENATLLFTDEEYAKIKQDFDKGKELQLFKVYINKNSFFKSVRAYMALEILRKNSKYVYSIPKYEKLSSGNSEMQGNILCGLLLTEKADAIVDEIMKIMEVEDFELEELKEIKQEYNFDAKIDTEKQVEEFSENNSMDVEQGNEMSLYSDELNSECAEILEIIGDMDEDADIKALTRQISDNMIAIEELFQVLGESKKIKLQDVLKCINESFVLENYKFSEEKKELFQEGAKLLLKAVRDDDFFISDDYKNNLENFCERYDSFSEKLKEVKSKAPSKTQKNKKIATKSSGDIHENIRIPASKADSLVDMLEELIVVQSQVSQEAKDKFNQDSLFFKNLSKMFRITKEIQDLSISFRMITLKSIFQKVKITVRDTAKKMNKKIDLEIIGEDTEIDRLVANKILDPLLHLVKNSIAHGIESQEERQISDKSSKGNLVIIAYSVKGHVYIEISDDGRGIDIAKVYNKAREKGLLEEGKEYTENEIVEFIMHPGFSTSDQVDTISGRGVGMDVVKTEVSKLGGKLSIETHAGLGSKFTIRVPKNMTAMNGTVVDIASQNYIIPTNYIKEIFKVDEDKWIYIKGKRVKVKLRDSIINLIPMKKFFDMDDIDLEEKIVVVLESDKVLRALVVTDILERREVVVKSIGDDFADVKHIFGAAILGDGNASLILDIENIFKMS